MKTILATVGAVLTAVTLGAAEAEAENIELEESEDKILEAGFDFDFLSAYVWRNAVQNDEMVMEPCIWADLTVADPFYAGFSIWQNYDLTDRRTDSLRRGLTETDYNVHVGATVWESEDGDVSFGLELGHEWYENQFVAKGAGDDYPNTREIYLKATFDNPIVNVYGQASWMYEDYGAFKSGMHYELGFNKEIELMDSVKFGADWNLNFGDGHYLNYLYGGTSSGKYWDEATEEIVDDYAASSAGFGGTTVKVYLTWEVTEWFSVGGVIAYTGILNGAYRDAIGKQGDDYFFDGDSYPRDFVWGGLQAKLSF